MGSGLPITAANVWQLIVNGIVSGSGYAMLAVGFGLIVHVTGRFHIAYAVIYAMTAFLAAEIAQDLGIGWVASMVLAVLAGMVVAVVIEVLIYAPLARRAGAASLFIVFIASLGINTAGQSVLGLTWRSPIAINGFKITAATIGSAATSNLDITSVIVAWVAILLVAAAIRWTKLGRMIRAVRVNPELSLDLGIDPRRIYAAVFALGTALGCINAVFVATKGAPASDLGQTSILYAVTGAFIAGAAGSVLTTALIGLGIGLVQSLSGLFLSTGWATVVVFGLLLIYVLFRAARTVRWTTVFSKTARPRRVTAPVRTRLGDGSVARVGDSTTTSGAEAGRR
jgi:branched-subunit amino acid ABC-type transport system permease component